MSRTFHELELCVHAADPFKVIAQAQAKLALNAAPVQIPLGLEERHTGLVDLVTMKAHHFEGAHGQNIIEVRSVRAHSSACNHSLTGWCIWPCFIDGLCLCKRSYVSSLRGTDTWLMVLSGC